MTFSALFLGHSFINRLYSFIGNSNDHRVTFNFNLDSEEISILYKGYSGATIPRVHSRGLPYVAAKHPDIVFLQTASNDLCQRDRSVDDIFRDLVNLVITLRYSLNIKRVIVLQVLHRLPPTRRIRYAVDTVWFNSRADELNHRMDNYLKGVPGAQFYRLKGFWTESCKASAFEDDGVHLNVNGNRKYYNNLRAALVSALKSLANGGLKIS
jgi:lysophospholipase L1-like esterase